MMGTRGSSDGIECDVLERRSRRALCWTRGRIAKIKRQFWKRERKAARLNAHDGEARRG